MIPSFNPATDETLARYPGHAGDAIEQRLERASRAQKAWARLPVAEGARRLAGGNPVAGPGAFYQPTVLDHVTATMTVTCQETFGSAAAILRVRDADEALRAADEALRAANGTPFGLGAALWTTDLDRAARLTRLIEAGAGFVNGMAASGPRLPFRGTKESGYGREPGAPGAWACTSSAPSRPCGPAWPAADQPFQEGPPDEPSHRPRQALRAAPRPDQDP